ncbi:hypothetical protein GOODEAATRI_018847 [Goodea atripinnis]|uniref:Uncharacterized protein n=1 Tax=Goodea atripinnis TaxID=208336 RepID=A0ABV0PF57_9TELE
MRVCVGILERSFPAGGVAGLLQMAHLSLISSSLAEDLRYCRMTAFRLMISAVSYSCHILVGSHCRTLSKLLTFWTCTPQSIPEALLFRLSSDCPLYNSLFPLSLDYWTHLFYFPRNHQALHSSLDTVLPFDTCKPPYLCSFYIWIFITITHYLI